MIKPAISPRTITASATTGLISAAKSGVKNIKDIKISGTLKYRLIIADIWFRKILQN